jgi:putative membrane protein
MNGATALSSFTTLLLAIILAILLGVLAGIITGLSPGIHINLVSALLLTAAPVLAMHFDLLLVAALIASMAVTHTFLDTIPSIFLGAPDDAKALGVLPGHRYLLQGNGMMAVKLCIVGGIIGSVCSAMLFLPATFLLSLGATLPRRAIALLIAAIIILTILRDQKRRWAIVIFAVSGLLGLVVLRLPIRDPLLPLLSGMFGIATLLYSINEAQTIPLQKESSVTTLDAGKSALGTALGIVAGWLTAFLPGMSASAAATTTTSVTRKGSLGDHGFLVLLGSLGSASFILSLAAYIGMEKARNGAMAVIVELTPLSNGVIVVMLGCTLVATGVAACIALWMGKRAASLLPRLPYRATCIGVILLVVVIVAWRSGPIGLLVLATSTAVGLLPAGLKTARGQAMGCLLLPVLVLLMG